MYNKLFESIFAETYVSFDNNAIGNYLTSPLETKPYTSFGNNNFGVYLTSPLDTESKKLLYINESDSENEEVFRRIYESCLDNID